MDQIQICCQDVHPSGDLSACRSWPLRTYSGVRYVRPSYPFHGRSIYRLDMQATHVCVPWISKPINQPDLQLREIRRSMMAHIFHITRRGSIFASCTSTDSEAFPPGKTQPPPPGSSALRPVGGGMVFFSGAGSFPYPRPNPAARSRNPPRSPSSASSPLPSPPTPRMSDAHAKLDADLEKSRSV